jgi:hypothetical protein
LQFQFNPPEKTEQILQQILWLNSNILIDKTIIKNSIIFVNDIINRTGGVISHIQLTKIYRNVCSILNYNQLVAALPQKWWMLVEPEKVKALVCRPYIKDLNWLKKIVM